MPAPPGTLVHSADAGRRGAGRGDAMAVAAVLACFAAYALGYGLYSRWLGRRLFALRDDAVMPSHALEDGVDYVPTRPAVLFGHHFASITGLSPMLGPAIAVIWGWLPAMAWVVLGAVFVGCVHDFGALVVSVRARGKSIGVVAEQLIGRRAKSLLHALIFFAVALAMGVFAYIVAELFRPSGYPEAVVPSAAILALALVIGIRGRRGGGAIGLPVAAAFVVVLAVVAASGRLPLRWDSSTGWTLVLLAYAWLASVLPVWSLLQPRDFLNSLLLYLGLGLTYVGFFVVRPEFAAPAVDTSPPGAPAMFPFVFVVIACGAASGFHALVASGTTAKQLDREPHARPIGYGGMIGESLLGLAAVLACTAGFSSPTAWHEHYASWGAAQGLASTMGAFIEGCTRFVVATGVPESGARTLVAVVVVSFALTTLDSATRLLRYNVEEIGESLGWRPLGHRAVSASVAVGAIAFFAFYRIDGRSAGLSLWKLFGSTNQLLAGLTLLVVSLYLVQRRRRAAPYLVPMAFMMISTLTAMTTELAGFAREGNLVLLIVGSAIAGIGVWLAAEAVVAIRRYARETATTSLDLERPPGG